MRNGKYILVTAPKNYPGLKYRQRYVYEHHLVWWNAGKGLVPKGSVLHHKNDNKHDNRLENLEILTISAHSKLHGLKNSKKVKIKCGWCKNEMELSKSVVNSRLKCRSVLFCSRSCGAKHQFSHKK